MLSGLCFVVSQLVMAAMNQWMSLQRWGIVPHISKWGHQSGFIGLQIAKTNRIHDNDADIQTHQPPGPTKQNTACSFYK